MLQNNIFFYLRKFKWSRKVTIIVATIQEPFLITRICIVKGSETKKKIIFYIDELHKLAYVILGEYTCLDSFSHTDFAVVYKIKIPFGIIYKQR